MFLAFCSSGPVQKCRAPSSHIAGSGVAWGRPSLRTVDSQKISAASMAATTVCQGTGFAPSLLNRRSSSMGGPGAGITALSPCTTQNAIN